MLLSLGACRLLPPLLTSGVAKGLCVREAAEARYGRALAWMGDQTGAQPTRRADVLCSLRPWAEEGLRGLPRRG